MPDFTIQIITIVEQNRALAFIVDLHFKYLFLCKILQKNMVVQLIFSGKNFQAQKKVSKLICMSSQTPRA